VERLTALLTVPNCRSLINRVLTDDTLLSSLSKTLDQKDALLR